MTWTPLIVVSVVALLSAGLGLLLYRFSTAVVEQQAIRVTGATAIAWIFFLAISRFYITVSQDLQTQNQQQCEAAEASVVEMRDAALGQVQGYRDCALLTGEFQCKSPADRMVQACERLAIELQ